MDNKENAQPSNIQYSIWNTRTKDESVLLKKAAAKSSLKEAEHLESREENPE